ncbi:CAP domain-containing protein [Patescibacteria group bacterium]
MKDLLVHLFLPHHTNNHRAKVIHIDALFIYVLFFLVFNLGIRVVHKEAPQVLGYATDIYIDQLLTSTNAKRQSAGLVPLKINDKLTQAAIAKAQHMFANNYWAHNSPDGRTPWEFITQSGYKYRVAGENLAKNFSTSQAVVDAWIASPTHRDNVLKSSYSDIGFAVINGVLNGEETTLVVQMFGATSGPSQPVKIPEIPQEAAAMIEETPVKPLAEAGVEDTATPDSIGIVNEDVFIPSSSIEPSGGVASAFSGVTLKPTFDLTKVTKETAFFFIGFLILAFVVDAYIVTHRRIIRVAGHNIAHILFLVSLTVILTLTVPGSIL